jgi:signal transduction histidine kinase
LREEIKTRERMQKALEQTIAELDAFGHTVAHDLKNPLMVINMSIQSLMKDFESSDDLKVRRMLSFINDGTKNMMSIIESILLLAGIKKIDRNKLGEVSVAGCVDEALKRLEYDIDANGVNIVKPETWPFVSGYAPWITEVWVNYINNAIKYGIKPGTREKPVIELGYDKPPVGAALPSGHFRFWVKDHGEGISKEESGLLFREFTRLRTKDKEGNGLGLSIVKSIVERLDGSVGVESEVKKGSLFYFTLPNKRVSFN